MLLINKHPNIKSEQLTELLMFVLHNAGFKTEHIMLTVLQGYELEDPVVLDYEQLSPKGEEVCCTEIFPSHEEIGDKYSCGISLHVVAKINENAPVDYAVEAEHVRLQTEFPAPISVTSWQDDFIYEMSRLVTMFKEGVIGQFIQRRHWWYRTQKYALERLTSWKYDETDEGAYWDNDNVDLFEDVFKPKTNGDVWLVMKCDDHGRICPRVFAKEEDAKAAGCKGAVRFPVEVWAELNRK